jgi:hypothetical protein
MLRRLALIPRARFNTVLAPRRPLSTAVPPPQAEPVVEAATPLAGPETYSKVLSLFHWLVGLSIVGSVGAVRFLLHPTHPPLSPPPFLQPTP